MELKSGDIIFYINDGSFLDSAIAWMEKFFKETGGVEGKQFVHVAMVYRDPTKVIEMVWPHPQVRPMDERPKVVLRVQCDDTFKSHAIAWCDEHMAERYSLPDYLFAHLGIGRSDRFCSQWIRTAFDAAGWPLLDPAIPMCDPDEFYAAVSRVSKAVDS